MASPLQRMVRTAEPTSTLSVSEIGLPTSKVSSKAISSLCFSMSSAQRTSTILRSIGAIRDHTPLSNVAREMAIAALASSALQ